MKFILKDTSPYFYKYSLFEGIQKDFKELHGDKLFTDFMSVRDKLEKPYNDMSYWMKKSSEELEDFISQVEIKKSNSEVRREEKQGAKLVSQTGSVKIYFITTYEAMKYYGKGTKWCIAGNYPGHRERGPQYFDSYIRDYDLDEGYYVLTDGIDKYCILVSNREILSIWNVKDKPIKLEDLPQEFIEALSASKITDDTEEFVIKNGVLKKFRDIYNKTEIEIPDGVTSIGKGSFYNCARLTSIIIPNSVTSISYEAFRRCTSLTTIVIPNSVTSIGSYAFFDCARLTSVTIGNNVMSIGHSAFHDCARLTSVTVVEGNPVYDSRNNCNAIIETATNTLISGCKNTVIPNNVTSIGDYAFLGCAMLKSLTIPNSVTGISNNAFAYCNKLNSITIPNSVTSIEYDAFFGCGNLSDVYYLGSKEEWDNVNIELENRNLLRANIHFNSKYKN